MRIKTHFDNALIVRIEKAQAQAQTQAEAGACAGVRHRISSNWFSLISSSLYF